MTKILAKMVKNNWQLLGYFVKPYSSVRTVLATIWAFLEKFGLLFTPTSGHTGVGGGGNCVTPIEKR